MPRTPAATPLPVEGKPERPRAGAAPRRGGCPEPDCGSLLDVVNDAIFFHDAETGAIVDVNRRAEEMYEATREELCAAGADAFSAGEPPYTASEALAHLRAAAAGPARLFQWHARSATGRLFWVEVNLKKVVAGHCHRLVAVVRDITERKRTEEALREADRRKDEFLGMLSHELRNPLAPIRNALYILDHAEPASAQARRAREVANRQVSHLTRLVDDLLDVTRIARGKVELRRTHLDLAALARRTGDDHAALMHERGVDLLLDVPRERVVVNGDETRLVQVVGNLLHNAAKFTPVGGRVTLAVRADGGNAVVQVADTGPGIAPELLETIFEPFTQGTQTLARSEGGLGLGLALVKGLVALHGGDVVARSAEGGRGAEFVVVIPLAPGARAAPARAPAAARQGAPRRRVLVVDDNTDAADTLAQLVEMLGHAAEVAYDGETAVAKVLDGVPDVVLCDVGLPGMDGYEVARQIRASSGRRVRLVAVTGYAQPEDLARAAEAGFDHHVPKPPDLDRIESVLG